eukprot:2868128-Pleurochrysis_carterae.AAC.1
MFFIPPLFSRVRDDLCCIPKTGCSPLCLRDTYGGLPARQGARTIDRARCTAIPLCGVRVCTIAVFIGPEITTSPRHTVTMKMEKLARGCELERTPPEAATTARSSLNIPAF